jgi:type I restriction enzyme, S subunit
MMGKNERMLPKGWITEPINSVVEVNPHFKREGIEDDLKVSFVPMAAVGACDGTIDVSKERLFCEVKKGYTSFQEGDVLFAKITPCMENGKIVIVPKLISGCGFGSTEFHVLRPTKCIGARYLYHYVSRSIFRGEAAHNMTGAVGQKRVPSSYLEQYKIPVAPLPEQHRIVAKIEELFSELDKGVENLKTAREQLKVYRQSVLKHAFEGKLSSNNLANEPLASWKWMSLEDITVEKEGLRRGPFGSTIKKAFFVPEGYKVYEQQNAIYDDPTLGEYYINKDKYEELKSFQVRPKDFIVSCSGTIGKISQLPHDTPLGVINQALLRIRLRDNVLKDKFFLYLFRSEFFQRKILVETRGSAMKNVTGMKELKQIQLWIPSDSEQNRIIEEIESRLSVVDQMEQTIDESLQKAEALRQTILKKAFEGKLVPQDPNDEPAGVLLERIKAEKAKHSKDTVRKKNTVK